MSLPDCCTDFDISWSDLLFPSRLSAESYEFLMAHGVGQMTLTELQTRSIDMGDGIVKIKHRCAQLLDDGRCQIYATRPQICKMFDCSQRKDCACGGRGWLKRDLPVQAIVPVEGVFLPMQTPPDLPEDDGSPLEGLEED